MPSLSRLRRIVIDDAVPYAHDLFKDLGECICLPGREITAETVQQADALIVRSRTQINADLLHNSSVQFVGSTVVGLDHVDQNWLKQAGITFYSAQGCNSIAVAEYVISNLVQWAAETGHTLKGKTLAIIGVGHVGSQVWRKAEALGMHCLLNDPPRAQQTHTFPHTELNTCLENADFITLHTPLTFQGAHATYHLLNQDNMHRIKPTAVLINAARGGIIEEQAWLNTPTAADIIDCWENEPILNPALFQRAWLATPHIAGHSLDAKVRGGLMASQALRRFWQTPLLDETRIFQQLPTPAPLSLPPLKSTLEQLAHLLRQSYDFRQDHAPLQAADETQRTKVFEAYRRHYPLRREWHAQHLPALASPPLLALLHTLGFQAKQHHLI